MARQYLLVILILIYQIQIKTLQIFCLIYQMFLTFKISLRNFTCFMSDKGFLIDTIFTNKPRFFHKTQGFVTGLSDFHKLVVIVLRSYYKKLPPNNILYRTFKRFAKTTFLRDLDSSLIQVSSIIIVKKLAIK